MKKIIHITLIIGLSWSCNKPDAWDCVKTSGKKTSDNRTVERFSKVHVYNEINVNLIQNADKAGLVIIHGPENLLNKIETNVENQTLRIEDLNTCNWVRSYQNEMNIDVYTDTLNQIYLFGNGNLTNTDTLYSPELYIETNGGAGHISLCIRTHSSYTYMHAGHTDLKLNGYSHLSYISSGIIGTVDARGLRSDYTFLQNESISDMYVWADHVLEADIQYKGNVYYTGSPQIINQQGRGEGRLYKL